MKRISIIICLLVMLLGFSLAALADDAANSEVTYPHRYLGVVSWIPEQDDVWDLSYALTYLSIKDKTYLLGTVGVAKADDVWLQKGLELEDSDNKTFGGVGFGANLAQSKDNRLFLGVGATVYWVEGGPGDGWIYVDEHLNNLGKVHNDKVFISPEIHVRYWVTKKIGVYAGANLSSEGQPPKNGYYVGFSFR